MSAPEMTEIPLVDLGLRQLTQMSQQLEKDVNVLQSSLAGLKLAQTKFSDCKLMLDSIVPKNLNKEILVPLNSSIYVPGSISNTETVLVDIGTGYYVDMPIEKAKCYYQRKVKYLDDNMQKVQVAFQEKYKFKEAVNSIIESKIHEQMAVQQQQNPAAVLKQVK